MEQNEQAHHDHDGITENREQKAPVYFNILFYGLIIWGIAFSAFYLLSGWSSDAEFQQNMTAHKEKYQPAETPKVPAAKGEETEEVAAQGAPAGTFDGASLYAQRCAMCHGADAKGGIGPDLTAADYAHGKTPEAVAASISNGVGSNMPAFGEQLEENEIKALVDYLLSL